MSKKIVVGDTVTFTIKEDSVSGVVESFIIDERHPKVHLKYVTIKLEREISGSNRWLLPLKNVKKVVNVK